MLRAGLLAMRGDPTGRRILGMLRLDGFTPGEASLFDGIAEKARLVEGLG